MSSTTNSKLVMKDPLKKKVLLKKKVVSEETKGVKLTKLPAKTSSSKTKTASAVPKTETHKSEKKTKKAVLKSDAELVEVVPTINTTDAVVETTPAVQETVLPTEAVVEPVPEKKAKKTVVVAPINTGLHISLARVKSVISTLSVNEDISLALEELKAHRVFAENSTTDFTFSLAGLSEKTLSLLEKFRQESVLSDKLEFSKLALKEFDTARLDKYTADRKLAVAEFSKLEKSTHMFNQTEFDLVKFNSAWDAQFYAKFVETDVSKLSNGELYSFYKNLVSKQKIRFNSDTKLFMTALTECVLRQLVTHATKNCVSTGHKIIKLEDAIPLSQQALSDYPLLRLVANLPSYERTLTYFREVGSITTLDSNERTELIEGLKTTLLSNELVADNKFPFKYYVYELCKTVKRELDEATENTPELSSKTSVSELFKLVLSNLVLELVVMFGAVLKVEVETRGIKTINHGIVDTMIKTLHVSYGISSELDNTLAFLQRMYVITSLPKED